MFEAANWRSTGGVGAAISFQKDLVLKASRPFAAPWTPMDMGIAQAP